MGDWPAIAKQLTAAVLVWKEIPREFWGILWSLGLMTVSAYPLVVGWSGLRERVDGRLERWLFALFVGMGYYTLLFSLLNALFGIPIGEGSFYIIFLMTAVLGYRWMYRHSIAWQGAWEPHQWWFVMGLLLVVFLAGSARFEETLRYADRLLDSDPYRHYPRTEWIVQTGNIAKWDPWLTGEVPLFEVQGCYVLAALLSAVGHVDAWVLWKYGSILMGVLSILAIYLMTLYFVPGQPRRFAGLLSSLLLAAFAIHITRTNMGFSVAWALPFLPLAFLMMIWVFRYNSFGFGVLFGIFFLLVGLSNMVPISNSVVFLFPYCTYEFMKRLWGLRKHKTVWYATMFLPFGGLALGTLIFMGYLFIWQQTYASASLNSIAKGAAFENRTIMKKAFQKGEDKERKKAESNPTLSRLHRFLGETIGWYNALMLQRYIDHYKLILGLLAVFLLVLFPVGKSTRSRWRRLRLGGAPSGAWIDSKVFLLVFLLAPFAQFSLLPYFLRPNTLENDEVRNIQAVIERLKSDDAVIQKHFFPRLPHHTRLALNQYTLSEPISAALKEDVISGINEIIQRHTLFNERRKLAPDQEYFRRKTKNMIRYMEKGDDLSYINRLIVEDFFPGQIERRDLFGIIRVPTFTGRTYRYLLLPALCLSVGMALCLSLVVDFLRDLIRLWEETRMAQSLRPFCGVATWVPLVVACLLVLLGSHQALFARGYGHWPPTSKPNEEAAMRWMSKFLPAGSRIFAYWFQADFIRSYSAHAGNPLSSIFAGYGRRTGIRSNMWPPMELDRLNIPEVRSLHDMKRYAKENPGIYYVFVARFGPNLPFKQDHDFRRVATFAHKRWGNVEIYELASNPVSIRQVPFGVWSH